MDRFQSFTIKYDVSCGFFVNALTRLRKIFSVPDFFNVSVKYVFCIYWDDHVVFIFCINILYYNDWFLFVKPTLHSGINLVLCFWIQLAVCASLNFSLCLSSNLGNIRILFLQIFPFQNLLELWGPKLGTASQVIKALFIFKKSFPLCFSD